MTLIIMKRHQPAEHHHVGGVEQLLHHAGEGQRQCKQRQLVPQRTVEHVHLARVQQAGQPGGFHHGKPGFRSLGVKVKKVKMVRPPGGANKRRRVSPYGLMWPYMVLRGQARLKVMPAPAAGVKRVSIIMPNLP